MSTIDRRREPAGSPVGGRFAALVRDAPRDLGPWTRSGFDRDEARAWHSVGLDPVTAAEWRDEGVGTPPTSAADDDPDLWLAGRDQIAWYAATERLPPGEAPDLDRLPAHLVR